MGELHSLQAKLHHETHMSITAVLKIHHQPQLCDEMGEFVSHPIIIVKVDSYQMITMRLFKVTLSKRVRNHKYLLQAGCSLAVF